jgi:hypothetical protein
MKLMGDAPYGEEILKRFGGLANRRFRLEIEASKTFDTP